jgi:GntR family transcriptional regulator
LHLASFSQDMLGRGLSPSSTLLGIEAGTPPPEIARALGMRVSESRGRTAWHVIRVRLADGRPMALENGWYPRALLPRLDRHRLDESLYRLFAEAYGFTVDRAEQTLWGEAADPATARFLDAPRHTPLLVFRRVSRAGEQIVEHVVSRYRGDRYQLHMSLSP